MSSADELQQQQQQKLAEFRHVVGGIEYSLYRPDDDWEGVRRIINGAFYPNECACRSVDLSAPTEDARRARDDMTVLARDALDHGVTLIAREVLGNGERLVVGHCINMLYTPADEAYFEAFRAHCGSDHSRALVDFLVGMESSCDVFERYGVQCAMELLMVGTLPAYGGRGIGRRLCELSVEMGRRLKSGEFSSAVAKKRGLRPQIVTGVFTGAFSQRISRQLGFEWLAEKEYGKFEFEGRTFAERIGDPQHRICVLGALKLS